MDPLTLLSEIYADGRTTAERLRSKGVSSLEDLCRRQPKELAKLMDVAERSAKKILSEAQDMLQGQLFAVEKSTQSAGRWGQRDITPAAPPDPFKSQVLDLLARRFR